MNVSRRYNLVEVILALGVVAIGVVSIMALFPIGANASRDASMETYAANVADEMLQFVKYRLKEVGDGEDQGDVDDRWDALIGDEDSGIFKKKPASETDMERALTVENDDLDKATVWGTPSATTFGSIFQNSNTIYQHHTDDQLFQLLSHRNPDNRNLGYTDSSDSSKDFASNVDFRAIAYVWKEQIIMDDTVNPAYKIPYTTGVRLIVRVTWPAEIPYVSRQKADYVLEVFKPIIEE
jgi:hypothetical protein